MFFEISKNILKKARRFQKNRKVGGKNLKFFLKKRFQKSFRKFKKYFFKKLLKTENFLRAVGK